MISLTEKVLAFQKSNLGLSDLVAEISPRVYGYPRRKLGWDEDACGDFYVFFQPRLVRLLSRFKDQGKPFESYLCSVLSWQLKNFARERRRGERGWNVSLRLQDEDPQAEGEEETPPDPWDFRILALIRNSADRRNLLLLALKCVRFLSPSGSMGFQPSVGFRWMSFPAMWRRSRRAWRPGRPGFPCFGSGETATMQSSCSWRRSFPRRRTPPVDKSSGIGYPA